VLTREGLPTTLREARRDYQGLLLADVRSCAEAKLGRSLPHGWLAEYERERAEAFRHGLEPVAGAAEAVRRVKAAGLKVCVASQGAVEKTRMTLGLTGLRDLFPPHALFSAHDVPRPKPDPALFQHAATSMNAKPSACVVIEDTPSGVMAAVAAGMRAVGYAARQRRARSSQRWCRDHPLLGRSPEALGPAPSVNLRRGLREQQPRVQRLVAALTSVT
jgi:HAD superfamily hydrolase (TIGR01509 family)